MNTKEITVLMVEPGRHPKATTIKDDLDSLQKAVSIGADYQGLIEFVGLGNGKACNHGFWSARRRRVGVSRLENPCWKADVRQDGCCQRPSSPASRTKQKGHPIGCPFYVL